jgi:hypothetical protein
MFDISKEGSELTSYPLIDIQGGCPKTKHTGWSRITNQKSLARKKGKKEVGASPARCAPLPSSHPILNSRLRTPTQMDCSVARLAQAHIAAYKSG